MAGRKIKLKDQLGRVINVPVATPPAAPVTPPVAQPETPRPTATVWKLIREIPANIQKLAKLVGTGFTTRGPDGEWYQRSIEAGEGIEVAEGDGIDGNPTVGLAELDNVGGGTLQKTLRDGYGRMAGTSAATTTDLDEGDNLYFTDERAAAAAPVQSVNGETGDVVLDASDVGADPSGSASAALAAAIEYASEGDAGKVDKPAVSSDAVFSRGDGQWVNWLNGDLRLGTSSGLFGSGRELAVSAGTTGNNIAHLSFQGSRTVNGIFGTLNYYHQGNLVVSMGAARDGADDAGYWVLSTKPTGGLLANRLRILSDGSIIVGSGTASNGSGVMQVAGNLVPFTNLGGTLGGSIYRWSATHTALLDASGSIVHSGAITPTTLAASANDYAPTGHSDTHLFRLAASIAVNITGIQGGAAGRRIVLTNIGANNIILSHDSGSSTAANRWYGPNNSSVTLRPNGTIEAIYDSASQRWRIFGA